MAKKPVLLLGKYFPVTIKTKRFLKPYLESLYGNPVIFNSNNLFGKVVSGLLERPYDTCRQSKENTTFRFNKFETELVIYLPKWWITFYKSGYTISEKSAFALNELFEQLFDEDLYKFCELARIYKVERKSAIEDFCRRHHISIEEDITYESLQKKDYRFKKRKETLENNPAFLSAHFRKIV